MTPALIVLALIALALFTQRETSKTFFFPWREWRHVRHTLFTLDGKLWADLPQGKRGMDPEQRRRLRDATSGLERLAPRVRFNFLDFDGEHGVATCHISECEWHRGAGLFRWLGYFSKRVERSLMLDFSCEVGKRKGSWKGGTIGHSITMKPGEDAQDSFARYCAENNMTFAGVADHYLLERYGMVEKPAGWNDAVLGYFLTGDEARDKERGFSEAFRSRAADLAGDPEPG